MSITLLARHTKVRMDTLFRQGILKQ